MSSTVIILPGSKSIAARALILNRVYNLDLNFENLPDCDDTSELSAALSKFPRAADYNLGTGGTSLRFFLALAASTPGFEGTIDCSDSLRSRPLLPLIDALRRAGAEIRCLAKEGEAPLYVKGRRLSGDGVEVDAKVSSQFTSALLLVSDLWETPFTLRRSPDVSRPYIDMTARMVSEFSALTPDSTYKIEPDWSAAAFFYEYALINPMKSVKIERIVPPCLSLQGDSFCSKIFDEIGVKTIFHSDGSATIEAMPTKHKEENIFIRDMRGTPDLVPALAVGMCVAGRRFEFSGVSNLRVKESDRVKSLTEELGKAGYELHTEADLIAWHGEKKGYTETAHPMYYSLIFNSHGDHRIAMALETALPKFGNARIEGTECISKSFPDFTEQLSKLQDL